MKETPATVSEYKGLVYNIQSDNNLYSAFRESLSDILKGLSFVSVSFFYLTFPL